METTIYAIIKIKIQSDLSVADAIEELEQNSEYEIPSTANVQVIDTEWTTTPTAYPGY